MSKSKTSDKTTKETEAKNPKSMQDAEDISSIPFRTDPEWTDFIINQLTEEEKFGGVPKMDGLRRMVEKYVSPITNIEVSIIPHTGQILTVIAIASVTLYNGEKYTACSDANMFGATNDFKNKLTALADSRAKSKAFREILRLQNTYTSEEINEVSDPEDDSFITRPQVSIIEQKCQKLGISVEKAIAHYIPDPDNKVKGDITRLKMQGGILLMSHIDAIDKGREDCPEEIK